VVVGVGATPGLRTAGRAARATDRCRSQTASARASGPDVSHALSLAAGAGGRRRLGGTLDVPISAASGVLIAVVANLFEEQQATEQEALIEAQLASAIGLLVGALRAGSSLLAAFESAIQETGAPLRPYFLEVAGRIRLGDDPRAAVSDLQNRVPIESFRLFGTALAIHWDVGGSLATTLSTVGQTIRDRVELGRRVRAQGVEANASVAVVLLITYGLAFLMWRTNPARMEAFAVMPIGVLLITGAVMLQAVGIIWMARLSRSEF
jgi:tight adherence protein B